MRKDVVLFLFLVNLGVLALALVLLADPGSSLAQEAGGVAATSPELAKWGVLSAALAVGLGSLGAAVAVAAVGSAAMGALSEKPELGGRALIFLGLAEGIAIYGLIIAVMILGKF